MYALVVAGQFVSTGSYKNVLVVGSENLSKIVNWQDRKTCVLFGDGMGQLLLDQPSLVAEF